MARKIKETLVIEGDDKTVRAFRSMIKNAGKLEKEGKQIEARFSSLGPVITAAFTAVAAGKLTGTIVAFEKLEASLRTVEGSAAKASETLEFLKEFSSQTPFQLEELTASYIKLKALGLDPTEASLRSFGNVASAMGKTLDQFVEAVADSVTGEFERLKEFGIKARSEGDRVSFTFQGVTTQIGKNAFEIEQFLKGIGDVQFAGAMEEQMATLGGVSSNFKDQVSLLSAAIGEAGFSDAVKGATFLLSDMTGVVRELVEELADGASAVDVLSGVFLRLFLGDESRQLTTALERQHELIAAINKEQKTVTRLGTGKNTPVLDALLAEQKLNSAIVIGLQQRVVDSAAVHQQNEKLKEDAEEKQRLEEIVMQQEKKAAIDRTAEFEAELKEIDELNKAINKKKEAFDKKLEKENQALLTEGQRVYVATRNEAEKYAIQLSKLNVLLQKGKIDQETYNRAVGQAQDEFDEANEAAEETGSLVADIGLTFTSAAEEAVIAGGKMSDVLKGLAQDLARLAFRKLVLEPLIAGVTNIFAPGAGSGGLSFINKSTIPARRASGGSVNQGAPFIVGERGPELFVPSSDGNIVSNQNMAGPSVRIGQISIDARGADGAAISHLRSYMDNEFAPRILSLAKNSAAAQVLMEIKRPKIA